jgi:hypothetical protein
MDSEKIQRVRRFIASGFYTDPEVLDSIEVVLVDRHYERLMRDIEICSGLDQDSCDEIAVRLYSQVVVDLRQSPQADRNRLSDVVADVVVGSLDKLVRLALMHKTTSLHTR